MNINELTKAYKKQAQLAREHAAHMILFKVRCGGIAEQAFHLLGRNNKKYNRWLERELDTNYRDVWCWRQIYKDLSSKLAKDPYNVELDKYILPEAGSNGPGKADTFIKLVWPHVENKTMSGLMRDCGARDTSVYTSIRTDRRVALEKLVAAVQNHLDTLPADVVEAYGEYIACTDKRGRPKKDASARTRPGPLQAA